MNCISYYFHADLTRHYWRWVLTPSLTPIRFPKWSELKVLRSSASDIMFELFSGRQVSSVLHTV